MAPGQVVTGQLARILAAQRANADLHGDLERIDWYEAADHQPPPIH